MDLWDHKHLTIISSLLLICKVSLPLIKMILHTIIVRGSLILAEFSDSEDDYTTTIKKSIIEVKNT